MRKSIIDVALKGRLIVRMDFNVAQAKQSDQVTNPAPYQRLAALKHILDQGASLVLTSPSGRPRGKRIEDLAGSGKLD